MCGIGKFFSNIIKHPLPAIGTAIGATFGGPLGAAAGDALGSVASGESIGKSLISGAEAGVGDYAVGALGDYAGSEFPETASSFNDTLGSLTPNVSNPFPETTASISDGLGGAYDNVKNDLGIGGDAVDSQTGQAVGQSYASDLAGNPVSPVTSPNLGGSSDPNQFKDLVTNQLGGLSPTASAPASAPDGFGGSSPSVTNSSSSTGIKGLLDKIGITPTQALTGAGLGAAAIAGNKKTSAEKNLEAVAGTESATGNQLIANAQAGTLPAGMDAAIQQQTNDAITAVKSKYASLGLSGSSSELQAINQIQQQAGQQRAEQLQQILAQGLSAVGAAGSTDQSIAQSQLNQDKSLYDTLVGLAGIGGGSDSGKTFKLTAA